MGFTIVDRYEAPRGCGRRKPGGKYLVSGGPAVDCGRLPLPLDRCPTCGHGIKATRGWTWLDLKPLTESRACGAPLKECDSCPLGAPDGPTQAGLLWVGSAFYSTPKEFLREASRMGISRRIAQVPKGFEIGRTWVLLAHRKPAPHAFAMFRPERIEYVVRDEDTPERLEKLAARGFTLVRVHAEQLEIGGGRHLQVLA